MGRRGLVQSGLLVTVALSGALGAALLGGPEAGVGCAEAEAAPASASAVEARLSCARACQASALVPSVPVAPSGRGLRLRFNGGSRRAVRVSIYRLTRGRRVVPNRLVVAFGPRRKAFRWSGRVRGRAVRDGYYEARFRSGGETRLVGLRRRGARFSRLPAFQRPRRCDGLSGFRLGGPAFGGAGRKPLDMLYRLGTPGRVSIVVTKGKRTIKRVRSLSRAPGRTYRVRVRTAARGTVRVTLTARIGRKTVRSRLSARGL